MSKRLVTNADVQSYEGLIEFFIRTHVIKNWREARSRNNYQSLGNTACTLEDIRQILRYQVFLALQNYNPNFLVNGNPVKESTFVYRHLWFKVGMLMKKLVRKANYYGIQMSSFEDIGGRLNLEAEDYEVNNIRRDEYMIECFESALKNSNNSFSRGADGKLLFGKRASIIRAIQKIKARNQRP
jgi:hypothetical protein